MTVVTLGSSSDYSKVESEVPEAKRGRCVAGTTRRCGAVPQGSYSSGCCVRLPPYNQHAAPDVLSLLQDDFRLQLDFLYIDGLLHNHGGTCLAPGQLETVAIPSCSAVCVAAIFA